MLNCKSFSENNPVYWAFNLIAITPGFFRCDLIFKTGENCSWRSLKPRFSIGFLVIFAFNGNTHEFLI